MSETAETVAQPALTQGKLVGQPVRRVEDARLLAGLGRYVDDRQPPLALHIAILRSDWR